MDSIRPFPLEEWLNSCLPKVAELAKRHGLRDSDWENRRKEVQSFRLQIPILGGFSAGKTSLINTLLGEAIFTTDVTPETAVAAEILQGETEEIVAVWKEGRRQSLTREDLRKNLLRDQGANVLIKFYTPSPELLRWPHITLVDLPGLESGNSAHVEVIDAVAKGSLAYVLVVSCEDGTLRESVRFSLQAMKFWDMPTILVVSKIDKRPAEDVVAITTALTQEVETLTGHAPLAVAQVSSRKKMIAPFTEALDTLEGRAEERFAVGVAAPILVTMEQLAGHLEVLSRQDFADAEKIAAESASLEAEIARFDQELQRQQEALKRQIQPLLQRLRVKLQTELGQRLESLVHLAERGGDVGDSILLTVRTVLSTVLRDDFEPAVSRHLEALGEHIPSQLSLHVEKQSLDVESGNGRGDHWLALAGGLTPLLSIFSFGARFLPYVGPVLGVISLIFAGRNRKALDQVETGRQREQVRTQLREQIDQAIDAILQKLQPQLEKQIDQIIQKITEEIDNERCQRQEMLAQLQERLLRGQADAAAKREAAAADLAQLESWTLTLRQQIQEVQ